MSDEGQKIVIGILETASWDVNEDDEVPVRFANWQISTN
jgi:hypothetical protein